MRSLWLACCVAAQAPIAHAQNLSFSEAVARAADGPSVEAGLASARAAERSVGPASQLPDPELVLGLENVPVEGPDAYRLDREFMTMQSVGIMQEMPSGPARRALRAAARAEVSRAEAALMIARLQARLGAAQAWIDLHAAQRRTEIIDQLAQEDRTAAVAARAKLAGGAGSVDDAISAEIEAAHAQDRRAEALATTIAARAELRRWAGEAADEPLAPEAPVFTIDAAQLSEHLRHHPELAAFQAEAAAAAAGLRLARAERAPDWSWQLMVQRRAPGFGDMASLEVRVGLPLFQPWRQGPLIDARRADVSRVEAERAAEEREHAAMLEAQLAEHASAAANLVRARQTRLPLARRRATAAAGAFAGGTGSTAQWIATRRDALEAELDVIALEQRVAALGAALTLQYGETIP